MSRHVRLSSGQTSSSKTDEMLRRMLDSASRGQRSLGIVTCPWSIVKTLMAAFTAAVHVSLLHGDVFNDRIHVRAALISKGLTSTAETVEVFLRASILKCVSEMR